MSAIPCASVSLKTMADGTLRISKISADYSYSGVKISAVHKACRPYAPLPKPIVIRTTGMSARNSTPRFCPKCKVETDRYKNGACKPCAKASDVAYHEAHKDKRNSSRAAWREENKGLVQARNLVYRTLNPEKVKASRDTYRAANPEIERERSAAYRAKNQDKIKAYQSQYRSENGKKCASAVAAWAAKNSDRKKAQNAAWAAANPEARRINKQNRRAKESANGGALSRGLQKKLFKLQNGKCPCCNHPLGDDYHIDHVMPLALGGLNVDENMQLLRSVCNLQKSKKHPVDFMQSRGFLL